MARSGLLGAQRRAVILEKITKRGSVSVSELHRALGVSRETIRRDITRLADESKLRKTHGGALSYESREPSLNERLAVNIDGKRKIGTAAAELVPDGSSLIIDSGSTTLCFAEALAGHGGLTIYTNDMRVASALSGVNENRVFMIGGEVSNNDGAIYGQDATGMLDHYFADFSVVGASAVSDHPWLTDYTRAAADLRGMMFTHAKTPVLLADKTKFNKIAPVRVPNVERVAYMLVDEAPDEALTKATAEVGVDLRVV